VGSRGVVEPVRPITAVPVQDWHRRGRRGALPGRQARRIVGRRRFSVRQAVALYCSHPSDATGRAVATSLPQH
jgi:hypothetical protein